MFYGMAHPRNDSSMRQKKAGDRHDVLMVEQRVVEFVAQVAQRCFTVDDHRSIVVKRDQAR